LKRRLNINPKAQIVYLPKDLVEDGFNKDTDAYANLYTLTIVKPGAGLEEVKKSLAMVMRDIDMRIKDEAADKATV